MRRAWRRSLLYNRMPGRLVGETVDADLAEANARRVNPRLRVLRVSARTGEGMDAWLDWLRAGLTAQAARHHASVDALQARIAELEKQLAARG